MLNALRSEAVKRAEEVLRVQPAAGLLQHPAVQEFIKKAVNLRADLFDQLDGRLSGVAKKLNLATRQELKALKRQIRELENQVTSLEHQLTEERQRADRAEGSLSESIKAQKKAAQHDLADRMKVEADQKAADAMKASAEEAMREAKALKDRLDAELKSVEQLKAQAQEELQTSRKASQAEAAESAEGESAPRRTRKKKSDVSESEPAAE